MLHDYSFQNPYPRLYLSSSCLPSIQTHHSRSASSSTILLPPPHCTIQYQTAAAALVGHYGALRHRRSSPTPLAHISHRNHPLSFLLHTLSSHPMSREDHRGPDQLPQTYLCYRKGPRSSPQSATYNIPHRSCSVSPCLHNNLQF